jgi:hypothetical protein
MSGVLITRARATTRCWLLEVWATLPGAATEWRGGTRN